MYIYIYHVPVYSRQGQEKALKSCALGANIHEKQQHHHCGSVVVLVLVRVSLVQIFVVTGCQFPLGGCQVTKHPVVLNQGVYITQQHPLAAYITQNHPLAAK